MLSVATIRSMPAAYPGPVRELRQRLMVVPPKRYGDQRLREYRVRVTGAQTFENVAGDRSQRRSVSFLAPGRALEHA